MLDQMKPMNVSYMPIMANYPQFENVTRTPLRGELRMKVAGTIANGKIEFIKKTFCEFQIFQLITSVGSLARRLSIQ